MSVGQNQAQYTVNILPSNATNKNVTWSVENQTGEATIDINGLLTATKVGTVKVIATASDGSGVSGEKIVTITLQDIPVSSITIEGLDDIPFIDMEED